MSDKPTTRPDNYVCLIGAQKSGTTSLFRYMATHPQIHTIKWKENKFFLNDNPPEADQRRYEGLLEGRKPGQHIFETSTYYTKFPQYDGVPKRIHDRYPDAKLLYLVRDPVQRIWSQYCHYLAKDWETRPFAEAVRDLPEYLDYSRYYLQISQYLKVFRPEQVHVMVFEQLVAEPERELRNAFEFLGVDPTFQPPNLNTRYNSGSTKRGMSRTKRLLFSIPGYKFLPWKLRNWVGSSLGDSLPRKEDHFTNEIREFLTEQLATDTENFREFMRRDVPQWNMQSTP